MSNIFDNIINKRTQNRFNEKWELENLGNEMFIKDTIKSFINTDEYRNMIKGDLYYNLKHKILNRRLVYKVNGQWKQSTRTNNKIKNPYHRLLVDQKIGYIGGNWKTSAKDKTMNQVLEEIVMSDTELNTIVNDCILNASNTGVAWIHTYKNKQGITKATVIPSWEIIPIYDRSFQKILTKVIRFYKMTRVEANGKHKEYYNIELWDNNFVSFYTMEDDICSFDTTQILNPRPHSLIFIDGDANEDTFNQIPFFEVSNNASKTNDLQVIEDFIDDLDIVNSDWSNAFAENIEGFWVLSGGDTKQGMVEFINAMNANGGVRLGEGQTLEKVEFPVEFEARKARIQELKDSIFLVGQGVNTQDPNMYGNLSGIAIKMRFSALNSKSMYITNSLMSALYDVLYLQINEFNKFSKVALDPKQIILDYKFNILEDATELEILTNIALSMKGTASQRTVLENLPMVNDVDEELERIKAEEIENPDNLII